MVGSESDQGGADVPAEDPAPQMHMAPPRHALALLATAALLLAAFTNCSLTGLIFLVAFGGEMPRQSKVVGGACPAASSHANGGGT